ncbi:MAG: AEC family transporter [Candidatus Enterenecus sp.]
MFRIMMEQIAMLVIYMAAGALLVRTKVLNEAALTPISRVVLKLALPLLIFTNTVNGVDRQELLGTLPVIGLSLLMYLLIFLLMAALAKAFRLKGNRAPLYRALGMFGNVGFVGIPIITSLFPENGMLYISLFTIVDMTALWTLGVKLTSPVEGEGKFDPKKLVNPSTVAVALAVILILVDVPLPGVVNTALGKIGSTSTPLAMIYLGGLFACMDVRPYLKNLELYGIAVIKMTLFPVLFYGLLTLFPVADEVRMTMALLAAMPPMSSVVMMAKASGSDGDYGVGGIFIATLASIVTLPLVFLVIQTLFLR